MISPDDLEKFEAITPGHVTVARFREVVETALAIIERDMLARLDQLDMSDEARAEAEATVERAMAEAHKLNEAQIARLLRGAAH